MSPAGLPRERRLRRPAEFRAVFANGIRVSDGLFTVVARPTEHGYARLGLAVSKRCASRAVARNRLKRVVRESFRRHAAGGLFPADYVVMCRPAAASCPNATLFRSLTDLWRRAGERLQRRARG